METVKIALLGLGTVGTGVYKVLKAQQEEIPHKVGAKIQLKKVLVRNTEKASRKLDDPSILTTEWKSILEDPEISIVVEVMGGIEPARSYILDALHAGKSVVTANKDLLASHGKELMDAAAETKSDLLFEASVAGGIPIIRPLKECLAGNHISEVMGIVNGTTNFILTKMAEGAWVSGSPGSGYGAWLCGGRSTADIEGSGCCPKGRDPGFYRFFIQVTFDDVYTEGITKITATDIRYAREMGCDIKLLGVAKETPEGIEARVQPMLIPSTHPLASVRDSFNAVFVHGDAVDDTMFYGRGAGELPTASAVVGDILDAVRNMVFGCRGRIGCTCYKEIPLKKMEDISCAYFLRMQVENRSGVLANIAGVFGNNCVSIAQIIQKGKKKDRAEIVVITDEEKEKNFQDSLAVISGMSTVKEISSMIRVYGQI